ETSVVEPQSSVTDLSHSTFMRVHQDSNPEIWSLIGRFLLRSSSLNDRISRFRVGCFLSVCAISNLGHDLQIGGDEEAGKSSSDAFGPGK
uniref:Uncharacterized protein n=1 Tax=Oryzias melastigma TaxID=30732 RepID=A0A3B3DW10_ORYME